MYCMHVFSSPEMLESHEVDCKGTDSKGQMIVMPEVGKNDKIEFGHHQNMMRAPYIIYADFETLNTPVSETQYKGRITDQPPISYCYYVVRSDGMTRGPFNNDVRNCNTGLVDDFINRLS